MNQEATEIEVEVLEVDGLAPAVVKPSMDKNPESQDNWRSGRGQVRQFDSRWWPLWAILGIIGLTVLLTVGLVVGVVYLIFRILVNILRAILG